MSSVKLQRTSRKSIIEKGKYFVAFGLVGSVLLAAGLPVFVILFFWVFAVFLLKMFSTGSNGETRDVFEFYLAANEILRDDGRSWFGFEVRDVITRGEEIVHRMSPAPPLVYFSLGALYNKVGDHSSAINYLASVVENEKAAEAAYVYPTQDLRNYVKILRKIERDPADAPLTSAAIRSLERSRRIRAKVLLEESRSLLNFEDSEAAGDRSAINKEIADRRLQPTPNRSVTDSRFDAYEKAVKRVNLGDNPSSEMNSANSDDKKSGSNEPFSDHKPITEVLHDIYDRKVQ